MLYVVDVELWHLMSEAKQHQAHPTIVDVVATILVVNRAISMQHMTR